MTVNSDLHPLVFATRKFHETLFGSQPVDPKLSERMLGAVIAHLQAKCNVAVYEIPLPPVNMAEAEFSFDFLSPGSDNTLAGKAIEAAPVGLNIKVKELHEAIVRSLKYLFGVGLLAWIPAVPAPAFPVPPEAPKAKPYGWDCGGVLVRSSQVMEAYRSEGVTCIPLHSVAPKASPETLDSLMSALRGSFQITHALAQFIAVSNGGFMPSDAAPDFMRDLIAHRRNWRGAMETVRGDYPDDDAHPDRSYWNHELDVFDRTIRDLMAFLGGQV
ncbi:hypothetical protein B2_3 [Stenotrophomonas phage B2]|nr:hypothetical protein B2_3 [Stenotrophomonas phage B2]